MGPMFEFVNGSMTCLDFFPVFCCSLQSLAYLWEDYQTKLADQVQTPLQSYRAQFPEYRVSIKYDICLLAL